MYPWRNAAPLNLDPVLYVPTEILSSAAGFLESLLPDMADLIGGYLELTHPLLRFCKVIQLAQYLSVAEFGNAVTHPLCEVLSWSRGASPILIQQGQAVNPWVRLTIDSRGIKSIESLSDKLEKSTVIGLSLYSHAYIVESVEKLSGVDVEFLVSLSAALFTRLLTKPSHSARNEPSACSDVSKHQYLEHPVTTCSSVSCKWPTAQHTSLWTIRSS